MKSVIMGLDYGDCRIGVALSDALQLSAFPLEVIHRTNAMSFKKSIARLSEIIKMHHVATIILGYPKNMDNSEGFRCEKTMAFQLRLERNFKKIPIILWDERLSTVAADRSLLELHKTKIERDQIIDKIAAAYILQGYLDSIKKSKPKEVRIFE